ncbi:hypothetical protein GTY84_30980 [Streptomyces sp. SID8352]|nr:hypothetical protein [Streptomyces sp. SID8352]
MTAASQEVAVFSYRVAMPRKPLSRLKQRSTQMLSCRCPRVTSTARGAALAVAGEADPCGRSSAGSAEGVILRFVRSAEPPISADGGGVPVGADDGGVDLDEPVDVPGCVRAGLDLPQGPGEHAVECQLGMQLPFLVGEFMAA